jgi:hypothetical protein
VSRKLPVEPGTFAVLGTIPSTFLTELGFAVAFGILLDTIIVRSVLVTVLNLDLGRWMWWPSKLARKPRSGARRTEPRARASARPPKLRQIVLFCAPRLANSYPWIGIPNRRRDLARRDTRRALTHCDSYRLPGMLLVAHP